VTLSKEAGIAIIAMWSLLYRPEARRKPLFSNTFNIGALKDHGDQLLESDERLSNFIAFFSFLPSERRSRPSRLPQ
jgi:hypothetical protein